MAKEKNTQYQMEELVPIVARLAEKYTGFASSSISYEKAQQLMAAVLYCIQEYESAAEPDGDGNAEPEGETGQESNAEQEIRTGQEGNAEPEGENGQEDNAERKVSPGRSACGFKAYRYEKPSAAEAYERGYELVVQKARAANELYGRIMENFCDYGNRAYRDTLVRAMPEFFLRYDARFAPQEELLLLDYPVPELSADLKGIDLIYEYLCCIESEQEFLGSFPEGYVRQTCEAYHEDYGELFINLAEVVREAIQLQ